jgi:phenylacetate-CoA ligase
MKPGFLIIDLLRNTNIINEYKNILQEYSLPIPEQSDKRLEKLSFFLISLKNNIYYSPILSQYSNEEILKSPADILQQVPVIRKDDIKKNFFKLLNFKSGYELNFTGGSSGQPLKYAMSKLSISRTKAFNYYLWNKYLNYNIGEKILVIGGSSLGSITLLKSKVYNFLQNKVFIEGSNIKSNSTMDNTRYILSGKYSFIYGYPSSIEYFVDFATENSLQFNKNLKGIITTSEMLDDFTKSKIQKYFNTKVLNIYGANDGGIISGSIDNKVFHYNYLDCFVTTMPGNYGKTELLLTNLNSEGFPFVNYAVEDLGSTSCSDSFSFPNVITNLEGRSRDIIKNIKGDHFHGALFNNIIHNFDQIEKYQIIQNKDYSLEFIFKVKAGTFQKNNELFNMINKIFNDDDMIISFSYNKPFVVGVNGKYKTIISYAV